MENNTEYHDPDYLEATANTSEDRSRLTEEQKIHKIKVIVEREFTNEIGCKEDELDLIDDRVTKARRMLYQLRCSLVRQYYEKPLSSTQIQDDIASQHEPRAKAEVTSILTNAQKRIHPSLKKLLGKGTVDLEEIFRFRTPRNKTKRDYVAMLQAKNVTVKEDAQLKSLRPESNQEPETEVQIEPSTKISKKVPRTLIPKITNVISLNEVTRNQQKYRYRIIIGNTSKYAPSCSSVDRSTHKWLLYVRGPPSSPDLSPIITSVTCTLHHTYAPHHMVYIDKPPFHISRRGWGEFPAKIEINFNLPEINPPVVVEHVIKLDRNYTGLQTLGSETLVDVWLYSNEQMLPHEFKDQDNVPTNEINDTKENTQNEIINIKQEPTENVSESENWTDFFTKTNTEVNVDEMIIKPIKKEIKVEEPNTIPQVQQNNNNENKKVKESPQKRLMKYMDPTTGKIYYLEMDFDLDISKVQEIVINSKGNRRTAKISPIKNGVNKEPKTPVKKENSLLKPEVKREIVNKIKVESSLSHIENDHCYILPPVSVQKNNILAPENIENFQKVDFYEKLCRSVSSFTCVRTAVNYLLSKIPVICDKYSDIFLFVVQNEKIYWELDFVKRRYIEWARAKLINKILTENFIHGPIWRTKQILLFSRLHGYNPVKPDVFFDDYDTNTASEAFCSNLKEKYPNFSDISTLSIFQDGDFIQDGGDCPVIDVSNDENVDVVNIDSSIPTRIVSPVKPNNLTVLPDLDKETKLRYLFIERTCGTLGIVLKNEDIGSGYSYSAVHAVILCAVKKFAEELIRNALAYKLSEIKKRTQKMAGLPTLPVWDSAPSSSLPLIEVEHVVGATSSRLRLVTAQHCAAAHTTYTAL